MQILTILFISPTSLIDCYYEINLKQELCQVHKKR